MKTAAIAITDQKRGQRLSNLIASLLPGIFLIGYNVGTGSVTAMSKAGANFGTDLLWAVLVSCVMTYYLMSLCSRFTMVTGMTLMEGFRRHIHPVFAIAAMVVLSTIILGALMGVLGILADVLHVWSATMVDGGLSTTLCGVITALILYALICVGDTAVFEKVLAVLVAVMGTAFIATMIIEFPSLAEIAQGLVPKVPEVTQGSDNNSLVIMAGLVGTTVSVFVLVIRTGLIREKGWTMADQAMEKRDAAVSATLMFVVSAAVMITAAATLHKQGLKLNHISEMIPMLEPIFGKFALGVFVAGVVAAGLSSHLPNLLVIPWIIDDYRGVERSTKTRAMRLLLLVLTGISLFGVIFGFKPVFLMLVSQACIAVVLPIVLCALAYLTGSKKIMGEHRTGRKDYLIITVILLFAFYMSSQGVRGLLLDLA